MGHSTAVMKMNVSKWVSYGNVAVSTTHHQDSYMATSILSEARQNELLQRMHNGDKTAFSELCSLLLEPLTQKLVSRFGDNPALIPECAAIASDVLMEFLRIFERYDPTQKSLFGYLYMAAERDMRTKITAQQRRDKHLVMRLDDLNEENLPLALANVDDYDIEADFADFNVDELIQEMQLDATEAEIIRLIAEGEREVHLYARVMKIGHLPITDQRQEVNKAKERLRKRARRYMERKYSDE